MRPELLVAVAAVVSIYLFNASSSMWWGGFSIGPRYFLPALPFLVLPIGFVAENWERKAWFRILLGATMIWSWIAVWGLSLAGQSFPSDRINNPLLEYALPNWQLNQVARNIGTVLNFDGWTSLWVLFFIWGLFGLVWWLRKKKFVDQTLKRSRN